MIDCNEQGNQELVLIDFGVSVPIKRGDRTFLVSTVGGTSEYRAPETEAGTLMPEVDYYSLGITIYALLCGQTPTAYLADELKARRARILSTIPKPDSMSDDMYLLIRGMTYGDVANRADRSNHNNRWLADDVWYWIEGMRDGWRNRSRPLMPGAAFRNDPETERTIDVKSIPIRIPFNGEMHHSVPELLFAMAGSWDQGVNFLCRNQDNLTTAISKSARLASNGEQLEMLAADMEEYLKKLRKDSLSNDSCLAEFMFKYIGGLDVLIWKSIKYDDWDDLGLHIVAETDQFGGHDAVRNRYLSLLSDNVLSSFLRQNPNIGPEDEGFIDKVSTLCSGVRSDICCIYKIGFLFQENPVLQFGEDTPEFIDIADLKKYATTILLTGDILRIKQLSARLGSPQCRAWIDRKLRRY